MKHILFTLIFIISLTSYAQNDYWNKKPISISYYGHYYLHPGVKIGTQYDWRNWEKSKERKKRTITKMKSLFISPQIGFYIHPLNHSGLVFNVDFGYQKLKYPTGWYQAYSIGLASISQINSGTTYIKNDNGSISTKKFATRTYFMPSLNLEIGKEINPGFAWFTKFTIASKLFYNTGVSLDTFIEIGLKFNLINKTHEKATYNT